jgi:aryl-alcohol dehydrogenase-like predicted oxidoreductase
MRYTRLGKTDLSVSVLALGTWAFRQNLDVVAELTGVAAQAGIPLPQLAIARTITNPAVDVAVFGARRAAQLDARTPAADVELCLGDLARIDEILAGAAPVTGPAPEGM